MSLSPRLIAPEKRGEDAGTQKRLRETLTLMEALANWADQMLAMDNAFLKRLLKLGARVQAFLKAA